MTWRLLAVGFALAIGVVVVSWPCFAAGAPTSAHHQARTTARLAKAPPDVVCQPLFVCDIVLDPDEAILAMATGDSLRWMLSTVMSGPDARTPHVLVKPTDYGLRTDLIIATDKRVCYVILVSTRHDYQYHTRLYYPVAQVAHITQSGEASSDDPQVSLTHLDFAYRMHGERTFMPTRVVNDGAHTYIQMPSGIQDMPVVFAIANDGSDALVNHRFRHGTFIVDGVPERLALVQGSGRGQRRVIIERGN
jgi:P-type conjugative transfer protein TrbG